MVFNRRREYLFLYTVKDANPNGNPLEDNHPRYDEDTQQALASDVRIKRTIRDQWLNKGENVFIDGQPKMLKTRFEELKKITGKEAGREVLKNCIDVRLFGVTFALGKEAFAWTGPVQFKWARSLNACTFEFIQGTSAFATEGSSEKEKQQRSFRNEYKVPFALMSVYAIANQYAAETTGATDEDLQSMWQSLWEGTDNLITRSKNEHKSRMAVEVVYKTGFDGKIGSLDEKVSLLNKDSKKMTLDEEKAVRSLKDVLVDVTPLAEALSQKADKIEKVTVWLDKELNLLGKEKLEELGFLKAETR
ncbi:MAG: type I-B CRISPR-associated protein Cas7/Csh2 [Firmicutes bacterium]|nr:type I-B CRISPR-associated protein Cas7/Csh2 [Bacillota bacterium]